MTESQTIYTGHLRSTRGYYVAILLLVLGVTLVWVLPHPAWARGIANYVPLHTLFETIAIVVAMLVFAVGWNGYNRERPGNIVLLSCGFLGVAMLDFSHVLSFPGMPDYVTANSLEKTINFWLAARTLAAAALLAVVLAPWRPFASTATRYVWLGAMLAVTALMHWVFLFHPDALPRTFVPGGGLSRQFRRFRAFSSEKRWDTTDITIIPSLGRGGVNRHPLNTTASRTR